MKLYNLGDRSRGICETDGQVSTTFAYRDVPFSDGSGVARKILVGACDICGKVISIPPQATLAIKAVRKSADVSIEAMLPAAYLEALDLACLRIDPEATPEFRKRLLVYYLHRSSRSKTAIQRLAKATQKMDEVFKITQPVSEKRRLSMKVSPAVSRTLDYLVGKTRLTKTDLIKGSVVQIREEIVEPKHPLRLEELQTLAMVASS